MSIRPTRRRSFAALTAVGVAAAGLALVPGAPASATPAPLSLQWEISQQFDDHLSTHVLGGGASEDADGVITFPRGEGTYDAATGVASVAYEGSVEGAFVMATTTYYKVTVADPVVSVDAAGNGLISAIVSAWNAAGMGSEEASTAPTRVVVTTFDAATSDWTRAEGVATLSDTPHWAGVLPADSAQATELGIGAGKPVGGGSFAPSFLGQLTPGVRAHFYASADNQPKKVAASFTASAPVADAPAVTASPVTTAAGVEIAVSGENFLNSDISGGAGVYVGLAPAGGMPTASSAAEGMAKFAAATYLPTAALPEGSFAVSLSTTADKLDPRQKYAVYTWQAHAHASRHLDTETPVSIDWTKLGYPVATTATVTVTKKPTSRKKGTVAIAVPGGKYAATGQVSVVYKGGKLKGRKVKLVRTLTLGADGTVTVRLPKSAKGKRTLTVTYLGDLVHRASATTIVKVKVKK